MAVDIFSLDNLDLVEHVVTGASSTPLEVELAWRLMELIELVELKGESET